MRRRALVIGAQTGGLSGVHHDVDTMATILTQRGFEVDVRRERDATQAGIREGLDRLVTNTRGGDAVVVYFSGHGGLARYIAPDGAEQPERPERRFIVPTDYAESSPDDFRGITDVELSIWLARLTGRTPNVTVALDCCHATRMVRKEDLIPKFEARPGYVDVVEHTIALRKMGFDGDVLHPIANPHAVRLLACGPNESAFEYTARGDVRAGIFTDQLRMALERAGDAPIPWSILIQRIRDRVAVLTMTQRPEVEGPARRLPFDLAEPDDGLALPVVVCGPARVKLPGAALLGAAPDDTFGITAPGMASATGDAIIATAVVTKTSGIEVEAQVTLDPKYVELPPYVQAHPLTTSVTPDPVRVHGSGKLADSVRAAIGRVPTLQAVDSGAAGPVLAEVMVGAELTLHDYGPEPVDTAPPNLAGITRIVADLRRMARSAVLRRLAPGPGEGLTDRFTVEWGRVDGGEPHRLPPSGAVLHAGERVYVRLRNESSRSLYFFVFDLGVAHRVTLVSPEPSGLLIRPGREETIGERIDGELRGSPLFWPEGLAATGPRPETLLVIVTTEPCDLSGLAYEGVRADGPMGDGPLVRVLRGALADGHRDWSPARGTGKFAVVHLDFDLSPHSAPVPETAGFIIDERPQKSIELLGARGLRSARSASRTVAIRVTDLIVLRNRALGNADVRIDTLVLTGASGDRVPELARTAWFSRIRDGDRLPLDNLLVYHGPAVDYLDIAVWVSRDDDHGRTLSDLLRDRLTDDTLRHAVAALAPLAPQAALAVAAASAGVIIINTAYELLSQAVRGTIGLYRTSFLASEGFGIGRHPVSGHYDVQDFSFAYEIHDVG